METIQIEIEQEGIFVLPTVLRQKYQLRPGDIFRITDFNGTFILAPNTDKPSSNDALHYKAMVPKLAEEISQIVAESGYTTEEMLISLREEREKYYEEHYAK